MKKLRCIFRNIEDELDAEEEWRRTEKSL